MLELEELGLSFSGSARPAFEDVAFAVRPREFVTLIGPSGCGKSTLLKSIAGLIQPTSGRARWAAGSQPEIAFIFQDPTLLPWMTALGNVEVPLRLRGVSRSERSDICRQAIDQVLLGGFERFFPRALSGGMRMRVSLARALTVHPAMLFLDEPFGALDAITRNQMNKLLMDLQLSQGWTGLMVTHSVNEAVFMSDRVLVMSSAPGRILHSVDIDLPRPRTDDMLAAPSYMEQVQRIRRWIGKEAA